MNELTVGTTLETKTFNSLEFGEVRTVVINDAPYFVGKDVALTLGYKDTADAIKNHVDSEDRVGGRITDPYILDKMGRKQYPVFINESGLYSLILSSKLHNAKRFKRWVTSEVLPSIRKTGSYSVPSSFAEALQLAADQAKQIEEQNKLLLEQKPKVEVYNKICNAENLKTVEEVAKTLGYGKNNFFALLRGKGILYYANSDGQKINLPKQDYINRGYFVTKEEPYMKGEKDMLYTKVFVTGKGETWLSKKVSE